MEGLIPFVYRAIVQYKSGGQGLIDTWLNESPSAAYTRLPGDSDHFHTTSDVNVFRSSDCGFSPSTTPQPPPSTAAQRNVVAAVVHESPVRRRVVA
ncbi:hypothetical protein RHSIM_Rhsim05G0196100 [Rhododendron simsii]|uniref:Legume-specific protein n=1 Tax=Rhododendron simsii TaxID=118357 RepID=A0A834LNL3_RHOSS|nr:hypothetical protein RHSIM_Rhsim05G0196100 [Rhododendron simsii]